MSGEAVLTAEILEPAAPHVQPILQIHRGKDAWVAFLRKRDGKMENLCSLPTGELESLFPEIVAELERDSYFSINSFFRAGYGQSPMLPGYKATYRANDGGRYLNACYVDIDFHDLPEPVDFGELVGKVITMQDSHVIPPASLIARSGRGIWLFWLLVDPADASLPQQARPVKVLAHRAIEDELIRRLGGDPASCDVARITRVPGSINSKVGDSLRVAYWTQRDAAGRPYFYTLERLAAFLGVELPQLRPRKSAASPQASQRGVRGMRALWQHRFHDFHSLKDLRGGFRKGCRNSALYIYGVILRGNLLQDNAVWQEMEKLGRECIPQLSEAEINAAFEQSSCNRHGIRDTIIAARLKVSDEEAALIPRWACRRPAAVVTDMHLKPQKRAELRRQLTCEIVDSIGYIPSTREMAMRLGQRGFEISHVQVSRDYLKMKLNPAGSNSSLLFPDTKDTATSPPPSTCVTS